MRQLKPIQFKKENKHHHHHYDHMIQTLKFHSGSDNYEMN